MNLATMVIYACLAGTSLCGQQTIGDYPLVVCLRDAPIVAQAWFDGNAAWEPDRSRDKPWGCKIQPADRRPA